MTYDIASAIEQQQRTQPMPGFRRTKLKRGAHLKNYGSNGRDLAVLVSGHLRAYLRYGDQEIAVFNAVPGFPLLAIPELIFRARQDSHVLVGPREAFFEVAMSKSELFYPLYQGMENLLAQTLRIIEGIRFLDVRARLIGYIVDLCGSQGESMQDGIAIPFEYTIEDVANEIGSTRPTTSLILNKLIKEKFVRRLSRKQLIVPNIERLKETLRSAEQMQSLGAFIPRCDAELETFALLVSGCAPNLERTG